MYICTTHVLHVHIRGKIKKHNQRKLDVKILHPSKHFQHKYDCVWRLLSKHRVKRLFKSRCITTGFLFCIIFNGVEILSLPIKKICKQNLNYFFMYGSVSVCHAFKIHSLKIYGSHAYSLLCPFKSTAYTSRKSKIMCSIHSKLLTTK